MNLRRPDFRAAVLAVVWAVVLAGSCLTTRAADRGLSMSIEPVGSPAAPRDRDDARALYTGLGFDGPLHELADAQLGRAGMRHALRRLLQDTRAGDRVFLRHAGPATGHVTAGRCEPAWLAHDGLALGAREFARTLQALNRRASQVVVVVDATPAAGHPRSCAAAGDWLAVAMAAATPAGRAAVPGPAHGIVAVAASAGRGGADAGTATGVLLACLARPSLAGNPLATFRDLQACTMRPESTPLPAAGPRLAWAGDASLALQPRRVALVEPSAPVDGERPLAALQRAAREADGSWHVGVAPLPAGALPGCAATGWSVTSDRDGFLYILQADAGDTGPSLVYPAPGGDFQTVRAGQPVGVPCAGAAAPPTRPRRVLFVVSATRLGAGDLLMQLGLPRQAAAACLRNIGSDDCPSPAAGPGETPAPLHFGATLLPAAEPTAETP